MPRLMNILEGSSSWLSLHLAWVESATDKLQLWASRLSPDCPLLVGAAGDNLIVGIYSLAQEGKGHQWISLDTPASDCKIGFGDLAITTGLVM
eukprot:6646335-Pyramimonas_sp.AAC.1